MVEMGDNAASGVDSTTDSNVISSTGAVTSTDDLTTNGQKADRRHATDTDVKSEAVKTEQNKEADDEWWEIPCSDEELSTYEPSSPREVVRLFTALANNESLELSWKCPPKRPLTPDCEDDEDEGEDGEDEESSDDEGEGNLHQQAIPEELKEFEFDEDTMAARRKVKLRVGVSKLPLSAQKKSGDFANVVRTVYKHKAERLEQLKLQQQQQQQLLQHQQLEQFKHQEQQPQQQVSEQHRFLVEQQRLFHSQQAQVSGSDVGGKPVEEIAVVGVENGSGFDELEQYGEMEWTEGELPADLDIDTDFSDLAMHSGNVLEHIDPSDLAMLSSAVNGPSHEHHQQQYGGMQNVTQNYKSFPTSCSSPSHQQTVSSVSETLLMPPPPPPMLAGSRLVQPVPPPLFPPSYTSSSTTNMPLAYASNTNAVSTKGKFT